MCMWTLAPLEDLSVIFDDTYFVCIYLQEAEDQPVRVVGNVLTMAERVDDEFTKLLQNTDAHSTDYVTKYVCTFIECQSPNM